MGEIFEIIFEEFPEAIFVAEIDTGIIIYANKSAEKLLGLPKEKLIGIHQSQLHPSEDTIYYKKVFEEDTSVRANYPKKRKSQTKDLFVQHSSGKIIPIEIYSRTFEFNNKKYIIGLFIDISKTKKLERKIIHLSRIILESERIFNQGTAMYNPKYKNPIFFLSDGAKSVLGISSDAIRLKQLIFLISKEQQEEFQDFILNIPNEDVKNNTFIKQKDFTIFVDGQRKILNFQLFSFNKNILSLFKDITKFQEQLQLIQDKNRYLKMLSECHKVLIYAQDEDALLKQICKVIVETGGYKIAWFGLKKYDQEKNIEIVAYHTREKECQEYVKNLKLNWRDDNPYGMGPAGIACREGRIDIEQNIYFSERFKPVKDFAMKFGLQSVIGIPIVLIDRVIGCLVVYSPYPDAFYKEEVDILKEIAINLGFGINLLRERKSKLKLLEQNILLTKILDNTNVGILVISNQGKILYVNKKFEEISGYLMNEVIGENINILKSGLHEDVFYKEIWDTLLSKKDWRGEIINKRKDGSLFLTRCFISPIFNDKNEISHFIQIMEDITLERYYQEQIERTKFYDSLTNLPNRNYFIERLNQEVYNNKTFYLLYLDIDNFSQISRKDGFIISDRFLEEFVINIKTFIENQNIYDSIFFARIGNDEFAMIIKDQSLERVIQFVEKLIEFSKRTYRIYNKEYYLSLSVGISIFPDNAKTPDELLRLAEIAFRRSKEEKGDGNYAFLTREIEKDIVEKVQLESILQTNVFMLQTKDKAKIQQTGFKLEYQPIFDLEKEKVVFLEALLRWEHPTLGKISPIKFIPVAEKNRLIIPLGYFVIEEVIKQIISWQENDISVVPIGINISYVQLQKYEFIEVLRKLLKEYRIDPSLIEFEITENSFFQDNEITKKILNELKEMGIKLLIDDFGIGYSSLSYLLKYKFDVIKIDQFFVKSLTENHHKDSDALKLIRTIIQISKNLNIHTIAEGIETKEQMEILLKEGCKWGQGYYLSYPLSSKEIEKLLYEKSKH